jgi:hypothetical protein
LSRQRSMRRRLVAQAVERVQEPVEPEQVQEPVEPEQEQSVELPVELRQEVLPAAPLLRQQSAQRQ